MSQAPLEKQTTPETTTQLTPREEDLQKMLACQVHIGTKNVSYHMTPYTFKRREDGVHIINLGFTWEKIRLAARVIVAIENPADVCVVSSRAYGQRAILKFARYTGATPITTRFTPGTFTNQIQKRFLEPRLLILTDPLTDHQPIRESSYVNIPTIAFCDTESPLRYVDVAIPCNNRSIHSIGIMYWLLAREVLRMRGTLNREEAWEQKVMPDLFFYREPEEVKKQEEAEEEVEEEQALPPPKQTGMAGPQWTEPQSLQASSSSSTGGSWAGPTETTQQQQPQTTQPSSTQPPQQPPTQTGNWADVPATETTTATTAPTTGWTQ